jgi:hypothetical protein
MSVSVIVYVFWCHCPLSVPISEQQEVIVLSLSYRTWSVLLRGVSVYQEMTFQTCPSLS